MNATSASAGAAPTGVPPLGMAPWGIPPIAPPAIGIPPVHLGASAAADARPPVLLQVYVRLPGTQGSTLQFT